MLVEIVSPSMIVFSEDADFVIIPGEEGDIGILENHSPLISNLRKGLVYVYENKKIKKNFFISKGVLEVTNEKCVILTESAENVQDISHSDLQEDNFKKHIIENKYYANQ